MLTTLWDNLSKIKDRRLMLIGDMVADTYLEGKISRISREAPVLVLEHCGETVVPGGAANAVHNAATLSGSVYAVGVVGQDTAGQQLREVLQSKGVHTAGLIIDPSRPTITKTRVMAGGQATVRQQIVRIDRESKAQLDHAVEREILEYINKEIRKMEAVVISDYGSGTVTPAVIHQTVEQCKALDIPCMVDSRYNILDYRGVTLVKQNEAEAAAALNCELDSEESLMAAGQALLERLDARGILITRGPDGMALFESDGVTHIPVTNKSEVFDVTGAGDTVVVTMMLAVAAGVAYADAARLANFAAGIVVRKFGAATTTLEELKKTIGEYYENHC